MKQINQTQLLNVFKRFKHQSVNVEIIGGINIPYFIEQFTYDEDLFLLSFGEIDEEHCAFVIPKSDILEIKLEHDTLIDCILIKIQQDIFQTLLILVCEYNLGGDNHE